MRNSQSTATVIMLSVSALLCLSPRHVLAQSDTACHHFAQAVSQFGQQHPHADIGDLHAKTLCFTHCSSDEVTAEQFWKNAAPVSAAAIENELGQYSDTTARVTEIAIRGRAGPITRISRRVGTASCVRDTYLAHDKEGYTLIDNPTLADFSQEAGYCGNDFVYFDNWREATYAILWEEGERGAKLTAYQADPTFDLVKTCTVPISKPGN